MARKSMIEPIKPLIDAQIDWTFRRDDIFCLSIFVTISFICIMVS